MSMRLYTQCYQYDAVGNILQMRHQAGLGNQELRWTRHYDYAAASNRLLRTWQGNDEANAVHYQYDLIKEVTPTPTNPS